MGCGVQMSAKPTDWEDMFNRSALGLAVLAGDDHRLIRANESLVHMTGREADQLLGKPLLTDLVGLPEALPPDGLAGDLFPVTMPGAPTRWLRISVTPAGQDLLAVIEDVSEQKALEEQLLHLDRLCHLGGLATTLQHDFSQPLNIIRLTAENALDRLEENAVVEEELPRLKRGLITVMDQLHRLQDLFDLTWSYGNFHDELQEKVLLSKVIDATVNRLNMRPAISDVPVVIGSINSQPYVECHRQRLEEALFQLMLNSCEALSVDRGRRSGAQPKGIVSIETWTDEERGFLVLSVSDTGPGLPAALMRRLTRPSFTSQPTGKGLGLLVAFGIVAEMGGFIELPNTGNALEKGARFDILLPLGIACDEDDKDETPPNEEET